MPERADITPGLSRPDLVRVLESAARLQAVVPDAVLVGDSAAALWANHRTSFDHDHVLADLNARFDSDRYGIPYPGQVLARIDQYYTDQRGPGAEGVATQLARQLANPRPADQRTIRQLASYKGLDARCTTWENVTGVGRSLAVEMTR